VVHQGWLPLWAELLDQLGAATNDRTKAQLSAEVVFLAHDERLHEVNLGWHPGAEEVLWRPALQEAKRSQNGDTNVRYRAGDEARYLRQLLDLVAERAPYLDVRYAF